MGIEFSTTLQRAGARLALHVSGATDVGRVRLVNEDSLFATPPAFIVADGMGGHHYGDRASQSVAAAFAATFPSTEPFAPASPATVLRAIDAANDVVQSLVTYEDGPGAIAGTTLTGIALVESGDFAAADAAAGAGGEELHWMIVNVGDSRVYGWNGRGLVQITVDHSAVQEMVDMGLITRDEALVHPDRNVITRAVGSEEHVETDVWLMPTTGHQVFLLCSDGLTKELADTAIAELIAEYSQQPEPSESLAEHLVRTAVERGGRDNITVIVVESEFITGEA